MKALEAASEKDQLNVFSLESFEILARRAQLIEAAHSYSPGNPDYSNAEDFMGWGVQRGGALVAPVLSKMAAGKAAERSSIMKEKRKLMEEIRLKRPTPGPNGYPKGDAYKGDGKGKKGDKEGGGAWAGGAV